MSAAAEYIDQLDRVLARLVEVHDVTVDTLRALRLRGDRTDQLVAELRDDVHKLAVQVKRLTDAAEQGERGAVVHRLVPHPASYAAIVPNRCNAPGNSFPSLRCVRDFGHEGDHFAEGVSW